MSCGRPAAGDGAGSEKYGLLRTEMTVVLPEWSDILLDGGPDGLTATGLDLLREVSPEGAYWPAGSLLGPRAALVIRLGPGGSPEGALASLGAFLDRLRPATRDVEEAP